MFKLQTLKLDILGIVIPTYLSTAKVGKADLSCEAKVKLGFQRFYCHPPLYKKYLVKRALVQP